MAIKKFHSGSFLLIRIDSTAAKDKILLKVDFHNLTTMKKSSYDYYAERQTKISNFNLAKTILINLGVVFAAITLIIFGITKITKTKDETIVMALPISIILMATCFLSVIPVNNKLRELRTRRRYRVKSTLADS